MLITAVYPKTVDQTGQGKDHQAKQERRAGTLQRKKSALWHIIVIFIKLQLPRPIQHQHVGVASLGIFNIKIVAIVHDVFLFSIL